MKKKKSVASETSDGAPIGMTKATMVYQRLRDDIIHGEFSPRSWLKISALCERYNIGASPVREALNRLAIEGFVLQQDQRGFVVSSLGVADLQEVIFTRCQLNQVMVPAALSRGDEAWEDKLVLAHFHLSKVPPFTSSGKLNQAYSLKHRNFHMTILEPCGSRWLLDLSSRLFDWSEQFRNLALRGDVVGSRNVATEHTELLSVILSRDVEKAIEALNEHVKSTGRLAMAAKGALVE